MKKKVVALVMASVMSMGMLAGCGDKPAEEAPAAETPAAPAAEAPEEKAPEAEAPVQEALAEEEEAEAVFVDGYITEDGDEALLLAFYEVGDIDMAIMTNGVDEIYSQYTVEDAQTDEGNDFLLVTFTDVDTQIGYVDNGDGEIYLIDENGEAHAAVQLSEEEAQAVYEALQSGAAEGGEEADTEWSYDSGLYVTDGSSDAVICFYESSEGDQVAYLYDGENELFAAYDVAEAELEDGTPYVLVQIGDVLLGYYTDGENEYIVDEDGNISGAAELSEEEAYEILSAVME